MAGFCSAGLVCVCPDLSVHVLPSCLCESLLPLPDLISHISRPFLAVLHTLSLSRGPPGERGSPARAWIGTTAQLGNRLRCIRTCSGSQSGSKAQTETPAQGLPHIHQLLLASVPFPSSPGPLGSEAGLGASLLPTPPGPCSATCLVCFPLLLPRERETPMSEDLAGCLPHTCPPPSFKKRRGHSVGGVPEQRYQSIPVCVAARPPTQVQDVLVREGLHHMPEAPVWGV